MLVLQRQVKTGETSVDLRDHSTGWHLRRTRQTSMKGSNRSLISFAEECENGGQTVSKKVFTSST